MKIGETYKIIRQNKKLTQKEICQKEVTTITLSKFENGKSTPNFLLMKFFLNQINMSFEEFEFLCTYDEFNESQKIKKDFESIISTAQQKDILRLIEEINDYLAYNQDMNIQNLKDILAMTLEIEKHGFSEKANQIGLQFWNNIVAKKEWYFEDLKTLNFILFYFPTSMVFDIVDRILERLAEYDNLGENLKNLKISILINLSTIYMQDSKFERAEEINNMVCEEVKKVKRYDFFALSIIRKGIFQQDKTKIFRGENILESVGEINLLKNLQQEVKEFYDRCQKLGK
ncbi:XRE family transcriptional regulator [Lactococcus lactis subsp. lactis]|uniref:helix-turn-helix domain-containing protein n=1 Tax=Lactococcus lactis TaxID=1358 RepID=UPI00223C0705|nr:helix-turn-helix transcriptional regulator [Lactococcus lactis]MCT0016506.1 XRE family transcriptional regulator [Lactococcus lactis subsp. lactis]